MNKQDAGHVQGQAGSCHSSYDNLETFSDEEYEHCMRIQHGVDPKQLAAQLEGIREAQSPDASPSSRHEFLTPNVSSPCSTPHSDPTSTSSDKQRRVMEKQTITGEGKNMGEIQLQLSHDDFDNTLNLHVIQARRLLAKDINGLSDPFVKVYLLPGRIVDNKRRTKHIPRTLNPEWHQTVMFQNVHREELKYKTLEITVWDYDRFKANDFLGEVILDMAEEDFMDNWPHWYPLNEHDETTGVELPRPTVLPPRADVCDSNHLTSSPRPRPRRDKSTSTPVNDSAIREEKRCHGMGRRRRSLGTLADVDSESRCPSGVSDQEFKVKVKAFKSDRELWCTNVFRYQSKHTNGINSSILLQRDKCIKVKGHDLTIEDVTKRKRLNTRLSTLNPMKRMLLIIWMS